MGQSTSLKCYIAAPLTAETTVLRRALKRRKVAWSDVASVVPGGSLWRAVRKAIRGADFVCAVVPEESFKPNVFIELGVALAMSKPVLVIAPFELTRIAFLNEAYVARADVADERATEFHLASFLEKLKKGDLVGPRVQTRPKPVNVAWARAHLRHMKELSALEREQSGIRLVEWLFSKAGAAVANVSRDSDSGADLSIWMQSLEMLMGNPVLVEVKTAALSDARLLRVFEQLRRSVSKSSARAGIVIYFDKTKHHLGQQRFEPPFVLCFSIYELVMHVQKGTLPDAVFRQRNRAIHGQ